MNQHSQTFNPRNRRTIIASLLAYLLLTSQLTPVAFALNRSSRNSDKTNLTRNSADETQSSRLRISANAVAPVPMPAPMPGVGPLITATKVDTYPSQPGPAVPGEIITYSITITNSGAADATNVTLNDTVDPNTTIVPGSPSSTPIAFDDTYNVIGNVRIQPNAAQGVLANDNNPETGNNTGLTASGPTTGPANGQATVNADGSFSYNPNPGFTGTDTFTYTVTDGTGGSDIATVTLNVSGMIWFVNSAATPGGDGRLTTPFNCFVGSGCFDPVAADDPGDNIFLYSGSYTGGFTFLANQKLIGQAATATLASLASVTPEPYSDPLPSTGGASPTITTVVASTNALVVSAGGIVLRGFTIGNTTGAKIFGTNFGTLTAGDSIAPDVTLSGSGQALSLSNGAFAATSRFSGVATTSSSGTGITLNQVSGTVTFGGTSVSGSTTQGILVNQSTLSVNFGNTSVSGGTDGISLQNNSAGTRTFGTLSISNNSGIGFLSAVGGGNTTVTGATTIPAAAQTAPVGTAIDIQSLATGTSVTFAATTVNKGNAGIGVNLGGVASGNVGNVSFDSLAITTANGAALVGTGNTGQINVTTNGGGIAATNGPAINISKAAAPATPINLNFSNVSANNSSTNGVNFDRVSGTLTNGSTTTTNPTGIGIQVINSGAGTLNFGNTNSSQSGSTGVFLSSNSAAVTFGDLDIVPDNGQRALLAQNNTGAISSSSGDISANGAVTLEITGASAAARTPLNMTLTNVDSVNSSSLGVDLNFISGNLTVNDAAVATNISNPTTIGIRVQNSAAAGTMNFGNTVVNGSGGTGVVLGTAANGNSGNITFGDLDIAPDNNQRALQAVQNTGTITTTTGTISTVTAIAVEITGVSAASRTPLNVQFESLSANGSGSVANGLILTNTSATGSPGGFRVNGVGTTDGSGGTIQNTTTRGANINTAATIVLKNMNFTNANSTADGGGAGVCDDLNITGCNAALYLNTVTGATVDNVNFTGTMVENGITAVSVSDFKLDNSVLDGCGNEANESCVEGQNLSGTSTVTSTQISFSETNSFDVVNTDVSWNLTISGSTFRDTQTVSSGGAVNPNGEGGFQFRSFSVAGGTPTSTINILNSSFLRLRTQGIQGIAEDDTILNIDITGNTIDSGTDIGTGIDLNANDTASLNFNILNNPIIRSRNGSAINITTFLNGQGEGRVNDNGSVGAPIRTTAIGTGLRFLAQENSDLIIEARRNFVAFDPTNTDTATIDSQARFQTARVDLTLDDNTTTVNNANIADINLTSGSSTAGESNVFCANLVSNNASATGAARALRVRVSDLSNANRMFLQGFTTDTATTWINNGNTPAIAAEVVVSLTGTAVAPLAPPGGVCLAVDIPSDFAPAPSKDDDDAKLVGPPTQVFSTAATGVSSASITSRPFISSPRKQGDDLSRLAVAGVTAGTLVKSPSVSFAGKSDTQQPKPADRININPPVIMGDNITWNVGTLPAGQSVTITFQVVVDNPYSGGPNVSNQGTVTADGGISVLTDDPDVAGSNNPTLTPIAAPASLFIRDGRAAEPTSGSTNMLFTVALSAPATGAVSVDFATADQAPGPGHAVAGVDYTATSGTVSFMAGEQVKTIAVPVLADGDNSETDETFLVNLTNPMNATIVDSQAIGTITTANPAGTVVVSELRTFGPGPANDPNDDFVELYNNTDSPITVPAGGYGLFKMGATCDATPILVGTVPAATVIPARGHFLFTGSAYSLANYGGTGAAAGDAALTSDIEANANIALFSTTDVTLISSDNRLDAVGFGVQTTGNCALLLEGNSLAPVTTNLTGLGQYSFVRDTCGKGGSITTFGVCPTNGLPKDTNDNAADFFFVDTNGTTAGAGQRLGAAGPENLSSPMRVDATTTVFLLDGTVVGASPPNRVRDFTSDPGNNSTFGTLSIRRRFTNTSASPVTRLRFRVIDVTTFPAPSGIADLRSRTSVAVMTTVNDAATCAATGTPATPPCTVTVKGTTLEQPPAQPNGGGFNSTLAEGTITTGTPLAAGASVNIQFLLGVQQTGSFKFFIIVEALP